MKSLVVYYSYTGRTSVVAKAVAADRGADLRAVEDLKRPSGIFGFISGCFKAKKGRASEIKPVEFGLKDYDTVYVGSPVWAGCPAPALNAFLEKADFSGKRVFVFVTLGGKNSAGAIARMSERVVKNGGTVAGSFALRTGGQSDEALAAGTREALKGI